jgi:Rps23 Pro-64 3,4-dihydroxylase Tpa1-like proline 4-hydroxylase
MKGKHEMIYNPEVLASLAQLAPVFHTAQPFKHIVIDGLFDTGLLQQLAAEFYPTSDPRWQRFENDKEGKLAISNSEQNLPPLSRDFVRELNAEPFLKHVVTLTGIDGLIPDPYLGGAGMHCIPRGGKLGIHADFNVHPLMKLDRRLNLLIYLNTDWQESYGGHLELWDRAMQHCVQRILPIFNRTVLFLTDDFSFHGHPEPLTCPPDRVRKSIAMYYYTNGRPESELQNSGSHGTLFQERPHNHQRATTIAQPTSPSHEPPAHASSATQQQQAPGSLVSRAKRWLAWR